MLWRAGNGYLTAGSGEAGKELAETECSCFKYATVNGMAPTNHVQKRQNI